MMNNNKTNVQVTVIHIILRGEQRETEGEGGKEREEILAVGPFSKTGSSSLLLTTILTVKVFTSLFCFMLFYVLPKFSVYF